MLELKTNKLNNVLDKWNQKEFDVLLHKQNRIVKALNETKHENQKIQQNLEKQEICNEIQKIEQNCKNDVRCEEHKFFKSLKNFKHKIKTMKKKFKEVQEIKKRY